MIVTPGSSPYAVFHEFSHLAQHARGTLAWRAYIYWRCVPGAARLALLALETEAAAMALRELARCGLLRRRDGREALTGLLTYVRALFDD